MSSLPSDLTDADCPLLTKYGGGEAAGLVARYNAAAAKLRQAAADPKLAPAFATGRMDAPIEVLANLRDRLSRKRYVVGCIGVTQAGKSSTVNCIVGQEVSKEGAMSATSSQPVRVIKAPAEKLEIVYLTNKEYDDRRLDLCAEIGLPTPPGDTELLEVLSDASKLPNKDERGKPRARLKDDVEYLRNFVTAYGRHKDQIVSTSRSDDSIPFAQRYEVTTHGGKVLGDKAMLLREAKFFVRSDILPDELELCDLPGLGSKRSVDDKVTESYLGELDGVFLFASLGENPLKEEMLKILDLLATRFESRLTGRAWVIFTKMDTLSANVYRAASEGNIFGTMQDFLDRLKMGLSQACLCSKEMWNDARGPAGLDRQRATLILKQTEAAPVPSTCPPALVPAWHELLKDGGITHIRTLMTRDVAVTLAGLIRGEAAAGLTAFEADLTHRLENERRRLNGGEALLRKAMTCHAVVAGLRVGLTARPAEFPILIQQGGQLKTKLSSLFDDPNTAQVLAALPADELASQFRTHARVLNDTLRGEMTGDLVDQVYQVVGQRMDGLPPIDVAGATSCAEAWQRFRLEDRGRDDWRKDLPGFDSPELARWLREAGDGVDGAGYLDLMRDKIDTAVKQAVHSVRARLKTRLGQIEQDLSQLTAEEEPVAG